MSRVEEIGLLMGGVHGSDAHVPPHEAAACRVTAMARSGLRPRREPSSRPMLYVSPLLAVALTVLAGAAVIFALMGYDPVLALYTFFITPLIDLDGLAELAVKASPLILIAIGLAARLPRQCLEHRRRGPDTPWARSPAAASRSALWRHGGRLDPAADVRRRRPRRHGLGRDPGVAAHAARTSTRS